MARGASRTPSRKKTTQRFASAGSSGLPGWVKGLLFVAVGFGMAYFFFGKKESSAPPPPTPPLVNPVQPPPASQTGKTAANAQRPTSASQTPQNQKKSDEQSFDFYTILPSSEISPTTSTPMPRVTQAPAVMPARPATVVPTPRPAETAPPATAVRQAPAASSSTGASSDNYILQSLSTSSQDGANTVATRLRDLGLPTQVRAVQLPNGKTTYRVQSGPFPEGAERDRALGLIRVQHLDPMVIRVR